MSIDKYYSDAGKSDCLSNAEFKKKVEKKKKKVGKTVEVLD